MPKHERNHPAVLLAATIVSNAAEAKDFMLRARIATLRALHRREERVFSTAKTIIGASAN